MIMGEPDLLGGVYVANVSPMRDDARCSLDVEAYLGHVTWLAGHGVRGIVPFGTNGEGPVIATGEKRTVLERLFALDLPDGFQLVPTVAEGNLPDTLDQLAFLAGAPATAVLVLPPYYVKPVSAEGLELFYRRVLDATDHPVIVYHIPKYAVGVPAEVVGRLPVWGVKDSDGSPGYAEAVHEAGRGVLLGTEDDVPGGLRIAAGTISALANVVPDLMVQLYDHVRAGRDDEAAALAGHLRQVRAMTKQHTSVAVLKRLAGERQGRSLGTVRPPQLPLPSDYDAATALATALDTHAGSRG